MGTKSNYKRLNFFQRGHFISHFNKIYDMQGQKQRSEYLSAIFMASVGKNSPLEMNKTTTTL